MPEHIKFLIDENLSPELLKVAHTRGFHAVHAAWVGLSGKKDHQVASYAVAHNFILATNDLSDFRKVYKRRKLHPGVMFLVVADSDLMDREAQCHMFEAGLEIAQQNEPINEAIRVELSENADGDWVVIGTRYTLAKA